MATFFVLFHSFFLSNRAATILLRFFNAILSMFKVNDTFPVTPSTMKAHANFDSLSEKIIQFIVCPECHRLYTDDIQDLPSCCNFARFPSHPLEQYCQPCNTPLLHPSTRQPIKFPYSSITDNLQLLFARPGFEQEINHWRQRVVPRHSFFDVYDGAIWNSIPGPDDLEVPFVRHRRSILFTVIVDWFGPFRNSQYSCGAVRFILLSIICPDRSASRPTILSFSASYQAQKSQKQRRQIIILRLC